MPMLVPRYYRSFPSETVCSLMCFAAFAVAIAVSSGAPDALAQSAPPPASQTSQPVPAWQTAAGGKMEFEVASIHPAAPGASTRQNFDMSIEDMTIPPGGRISATGALGMFIQFAYKLSVFQDKAAFDHLPKWATTEYFDIEAKAPTTNVTKDQMRLMMQSLLADRFKLAVHFETPDGPAMALVLVNPGKLGPRLRPHSEGPACDAKIPPIDRSSPKIPDVWIPVCGTTQMVDWRDKTVILGSRNTTLDIFSDWIPLIETLDRPVVNRTGLTERFDIELNFTPPWIKDKEQSADAPLDLTGPTFLEALKDQLGLKLVSTRAPVRTLVIDNVEQPSTN
ncbi:MAG: TIGR03435 family protein [Terracidiphilus sp.]